MARIRSLKPEFWDDEELAMAVSRDARMLYMAMWNIADEHCRLRGDPRYIKGKAFAYDDDLTPDVIAKLIAELVCAGRVVPYRSGGGRYLFLPKLGKHQRLEPDKTPSRLPAPEDADPEPEPPSGIFSDESAKFSGLERSIPPSGTPDASSQVNGQSEKIPEESALACARLLSKEQVAGSREQVAGVPPSAGSAHAPCREPLIAEIITTEPPDPSRNHPPHPISAPSGAPPGNELAPLNPPQGDIETGNTRTILAAWIDHCATRNVQLTKRVKGHYAKRIKDALDEGFDEDTIKRALAQLLNQGDAGRPSLLDNKLIDVQNGPRRRPRTLTPGEESVRRAVETEGAQVIELFHEALRGSA